MSMFFANGRIVTNTFNSISELVFYYIYFTE